MPIEADPIEPSFEVPKRLKESLEKMYKLATLPTEEAVAYKHEAMPTDFETVMGGLVGRIVSLPYRLFKDIVETGGAAYGGVESLKGGPRGETGDWTPEQYGAAITSTMTAAMGVGGGGGAAAPGAIGRGEAYKMLARDFRALSKGFAKKEGFLARHGIPKETAETAIKTLKGREAATYREIAIGLKDIPQEVLDPVKGVRLIRGKGEQLGAYGIRSRQVKLAIDQPTEHALGSLGHEFIHSQQHVKSPGMVEGGKRVPLLEKHAYAAEKSFIASVKALPKGERITKQAFDDIYKAGLRALKTVKERQEEALLKLTEGRVIK